MDILSFLKSENRIKQDIVSRLLDGRHISAKEAAILLNGTTRINISKLEMSSGAKVVGGDDYETNNR